MAKKRRRRQQKLKNNLVVALFGLYFFILLVENYATTLMWLSSIGFVFYLTYRYLPKMIKNQKMKKANISTIDTMSGEEFEEYLTFFFKWKGYNAEKTKSSGDFGADIVLKKDGVTTVVQSKRYKGKVDLSAVQEIVTSMKMYRANNAMVVTNSYFTAPALKLAKVNNVELWDRDILIDELSKMNVNDNDVYAMKLDKN